MQRDQRDPRFPHFDVFPITGALGADVRGADLGASADAAVIEDLQRVLDHYHVIAVRDLQLSPEDFHRVARRFGPFSGNPVHVPMPGLDDVIRFVREADDTGKVIGEDWHMDLAWLARPPGLTMLYGEVIPPVGGDTCFASLAQAYRALSPGLQQLLRGRNGVHSGKGVFAINAANARLALREDAAHIENIEAVHPLICEHPVTGVPYLFVSSVLQNIEGLSEDESRPIIDYLMKTAVRPEFHCRVRWAPGTLTIWANPYVLHTAINDYSGYRRVTYRTTVEGAVPKAATAATASASPTASASASASATAMKTAPAVNPRVCP